MLESRRGTLAIVHEVRGKDNVAEVRKALELVRASVQARDAPWTPHQLTRVHFLRWFLLWDREVAGETERCLLVFLSCFDGSPREHLEQLYERAGDAIETILKNVIGYERRNPKDNPRFMLSHARYVDAIHVGAPELPVERILGDARVVDEVRGLFDAGPDAWLAQSGWVTRDPVLGSKKSWDGWDIAGALRRWVHSERSGLRALLEVPRRQPQFRFSWLPLAVALPILAPFSIVVFPPARPFALAYLGVLLALGVHLLRGQRIAGEKPDVTRSDELRWVREDEERAVQNPMTLVTRLRDGFMNRLGLRAALLLVQLMSRLHFNRGSLGPISTIHFGRWFVIRHPERRERYLVFESNWDFSWESYLDDFTDQKAVRMALNLIWRHTVGYPRVGFLLDGGCNDAAPFLDWVRRHQIRTHVWYSAYPSLDLRTILENEFRRDGLLEEPREKEREQEWLRSW